MSAVSSPKVNIVTPVFISGGIWVKTDGFWGVFWKKKGIFALHFGKMWIFSHNTRHCPDEETYVPFMNQANSDLVRLPFVSYHHQVVDTVVHLIIFVGNEILSNWSENNNPESTVLFGIAIVMLKIIFINSFSYIKAFCDIMAK